MSWATYTPQTWPSGGEFDVPHTGSESRAPYTNTATRYQTNLGNEEPTKEKWSAILRAVSANYTGLALSFGITQKTVRGWIFGRRPGSGLQYPRGIYNR